MADFKGKWEDDMIKNVPNSIKEIEKKILPVIREKANSELLMNMRDGNIANTTNINTNDINNTNSMGNQEQAKVRTLTRENTPKVINNVPSEPVRDNTNREYSHIPSDNPFESLRNNGNATSSTVLIVIASFVIVAMLIVICLTLLGTFGVNI